MKNIDGVLKNVTNKNLKILYNNPKEFWEGVTEIGDDAFKGCENLTTITIPNGITTIGECAFYGCENLTTISIPNSVTKIGKAAFYGCENLTTITIPDSVTEIGEYAFIRCKGLTTINIPNGVAEIGKYTFNECINLRKITISNSVTKIGEYAFAACENLTTITVPNGVTEIGECAFAGCKNLTKITIPDSATQIGSYAFYECTSLITITIPNSVTQIGEFTFEHCLSLTTVVIPDSVTKIGESAFAECTHLTKITILDSVKEIGKLAFDECDDLKTISVPYNIEKVGVSALPLKSTIIFKSPVRDYKVNEIMFDDEYTSYKDPKKRIRQIYLMSKNIPLELAKKDVGNNNTIFKNLLSYNNIINKYVYFNINDFSLYNLYALIKLGSSLGLFSNETIIQKDLNGINFETPALLLAEKVIKSILNKVAFEAFDEYFGLMDLNKFSPNFLEYLSNSENLKSIIQNKDKGESLQDIYNKCLARDNSSATERS